ncbi:MAG: SGNH/GDSL hydrolase family protein [Janthinobacterium lividum]
MSFESQITDLAGLSADFNSLQTQLDLAVAVVTDRKASFADTIDKWKTLVEYYENLADQADGGVVVATPVPVYSGLVIEGDSITDGGGQNDSSWPAQFATLTGIPIRDVALQGQTLFQMSRDYDLDGGAGTVYSSVYNTLVLAAGTNDFGQANQSVAQLKIYLQEFLAKARNSGYKIWVSTVTPRNDTGWTSALEAKRVEYNTWMLSGALTSLLNGGGVIDLASVITVADLYDGLHPTNAGAAKIAAAVRSALLASAVLSGDILGADGKVDDALWTAMVNAYWTDAAFEYRMGKKSAAIAGLPTWSQPVSQSMGSNYDNRSYEYGTFVTGYTDFSSTELIVGFTPADPAARIGVAGIQGISFSQETASVRPVLSWVHYTKGMDGVDLQYWRENGYPTMSKPVAVTQGFGRPGWNVKATAFFQDGSFACIGTNTDRNKSHGQLLPSKRITAAATFSSDEMMFVTVWDVDTKQAEIAVVMKCGLGDSATIENPYSGNPYGWWGEWNAAYPGLQNLGNNVFFKVVGYLPLVGMKAPTGIACTSGQHRHAYLNGTEPFTNGALGDWVNDESMRQRWCAPSGDRATNVVRQGVLMVWSKSEQIVGFYDVKPVIDYINKNYFGTRADFLKTRDIGQAPGQWPYSFDVAPEQKPVHIKNVPLPARPTAGCVFGYCYSDSHRQAWLALDNETMWTFNMGGFAQPFDGQPGAAIGSASALVKVAETPIPKNVTAITQTRERNGNNFGLLRDSTRCLIVTSREEKSVSWYDMENPSQPGVLVRKAQDSRWVDPVHAEDMENHGTESYVAMVADREGGCVWGLGWGPIKLWTMGNYVFPLLNNEQFNNLNKFVTEGKPFITLGINVS